jgi:glutamate carboxypeptidase
MSGSVGSDESRGTAVIVDSRAVVRFLESQLADFVEALRELVAIDCGTFSTTGVNRIADLCEARFRAWGWSVERRQHEPVDAEPPLGDIVVGRRGGGGRPHVLLIGHMDTVFPDGTVATRPFSIKGNRAMGPGVNDMKAGLLAGFFAIDALRHAGSSDFNVTYVCNPDEEVGSPFSKPVIQEIARDVDVCFVLEAGRENGNIVSARKGMAHFGVDIKGRAAHAGVEPEKGRSAILEAARIVLELHALNGLWAGVTVNAGAISGGTRPNVVPDFCHLEIDLRGADDVSFDEASRAIRRIATTTTMEGVSASIHALEAHRPMRESEATTRLVQLAQDITRQLGFEVMPQSTGGASDGNTTAAMGVPTLDGLGPVGGGPHSPEEWLDLDSIVPRTAMLACLIARANEVLPPTGAEQSHE